MHHKETDMVRILISALAVLALAACQLMPESGKAPAGTPIHSSATLMESAAGGGSAPATGRGYNAAIVKDLEITDARPAEFEAMRDELARLFGTSFRETLQREGYVRLALPGASTADVMTIQSATMRVSPAELEIAVAVRDARGRLMGWYAVQYSSGPVPGASTVSRADLLRRVFADAGEQAAKAIAKAR